MTTSSIPPDTNEFTGKRVLVTGGTKGAGKAIADRFQRGGATVIITARSAPTEKTDNPFIQADVSTPEGTTKVINEILNRRAAIKAWKTDSSAKYEYTCEPFACEQKDGQTVVTSHLAGNFPGSPIDLRFFFQLEGDKISSLEIIP
jgi:NAD(P)-dependent dehydrogenase (short-subunit alcohol dehydrogenase family)